MRDLGIEAWKAGVKADENAVVLDVRTPGECAAGIIPNALVIDLMKGPGFITEVEVLDKDKTYYIYCRSGNRSGQACLIMQNMGFKTYNLIGGVMQWDEPLAQLV